MKFIKLECPNCGGKLEVDENEKKATCIHCSYDFIVEKEPPEIHHHYYQSQKTTHTQTFPSATKIENNASVPVFIISVIVISAALFILPIVILSQRDTPTYNIVSAAGDQLSVDIRTKPESIPVINFVEYLFRKPVADISEEEFNTIKYIKIKTNTLSDGWDISYSFSDYTSTPDFDKTIKTMEIQSDEIIDKIDMQVFGGLTALHLPESYDLSNSYDEISFKHIKDLTAYSGSFNQSLSNAAQNTFPNIGQMTSLSMQIQNQEDIELLLTLTNLENLTITYIGDDATNLGQLSALNSLTTLSVESGTDLSWISSLNHLTTLKLDCYKATDYGVLYGLPSVENLTVLSGSGIKTIAFVKNMPKLKSLTIDRTNILDIEPLRGMTGLQYLELINNYELTDLSSLSTLSSLLTLNIDSYGNKIPDLSPLKQLTNLSIYISELESAKGASNLKHLSLQSNGDLHVEELASFTKLESIEIKDSTLYNTIEFNTIPNLRKIKLNDVKIRPNDDNLFLFQLDNVELLSIVNSRMYFDDLFALSGKQNTVLKELYLTSELSNRATDYNVVSFHEFKSVNEFLPNLEVLHVPNQKITSLDFVTFMPKLQEINVINNYISDITPLLDLEALKILWIEKNEVVNLELLDSSIWILK